MRLSCDVSVVVRRDRQCSGSEITGRSLKSTLALGSDVDKSSYFILHFSSQNKLGKKYKVNDNIEQVFIKFCHEGKATIKFKSPPHDLLIRSDPIQLKTFLKALKLCLEGKGCDIKLSNLSNISVLPNNPAPTKLAILSISDLPSKGYPRTLTHLQISGIKMCNFKRDILSLRNLRVLNLSDNFIEKLPPEIGGMPYLVELILNNNKLGCANHNNWKWIEGLQITKNLKLLDLSSNALNGNVPLTIFKLKNLVTLKLNNNQLTFLPDGIGTIRSLRYLSVAKNNLSSLPASLLLLRLMELDISSNLLKCTEVQHTPNIVQSFKTKTLVELSSVIVLKSRIYYAPNIIPYTLVDYLDNSKFCVCATPTFDSVNYVKFVRSTDTFVETVISNRLHSVDFDCYLCSYKCFRKYVTRKRPR